MLLLLCPHFLRLTKNDLTYSFHMLLSRNPSRDPIPRLFLEPPLGILRILSAGCFFLYCLILVTMIRLELCFDLYTCFLLIFSGVSFSWSGGFGLVILPPFVLVTLLIPGPDLASTTWFQWRPLPAGNFMNLLTNRTQALQISPLRSSSKSKHFSKHGS